MADYRNDTETEMRTQKEYKYGSKKVYPHLKAHQAKDNIRFSCSKILKCKVFIKMHLVENI